MSDKKKNGKKLSFMQFFKENKAVAAVVIGAVAVLAVAGILIGIFAGKGTKNQEQAEETETETLLAEAETETGDGLVPLELDAYPEVNDLISRYFAAITAGDRSQVKSLTDITDEEALLYIEMRSNFVEAYNDLQCYTKVGPIENSYVAYVSYNVKFIGIERQVPGVSPYLIYPREDGTLYIHEGEVPEEVNDYLEEISVQDDVVDLMNEVQVAFNDTILNDEGMNNFLAEMKEELQVAVGEALAVVEANQAQAQEAAANPAPMFTVGSKVKATDVVNVRKSDSEQADKLGKLQIGDTYTVVESKANGWTKITYDGKDGYVKSDYLAAVEDSAAGGEQEQQSEEPAAQTDGSLPASGTIKVGATVNIRKSASETADKIAVCYQGEKLEILMQQADGWTKVKFEGKTGYVKTSVLEVLD